MGSLVLASPCGRFSPPSARFATTSNDCTALSSASARNLPGFCGFPSGPGSFMRLMSSSATRAYSSPARANFSRAYRRAAWEKRISEAVRGPGWGVLGRVFELRVMLDGERAERVLGHLPGVGERLHRLLVAAALLGLGQHLQEPASLLDRQLLLPHAAGAGDDARLEERSLRRGPLGHDEPVVNEDGLLVLALVEVEPRQALQHVARVLAPHPREVVGRGPRRANVTIG